jgi:hypothetical protein
MRKKSCNISGIDGYSSFLVKVVSTTFNQDTLALVQKGAAFSKF